MSSPAPDTYKPVNWRPLAVPDSFRLVRLAAGQVNDPLSCSLREVTFEEINGRYLALSYAWGGTALTHTISCSNHRVQITANLHAALRRIRQPSTDIHIWCDAICIRQGGDTVSIHERGEQIILMEQIFSSAVRVIVDLGDDDGTLTQAVVGINAILKSSQELRGRCHLQPKPWEYLGLPEFTDPMWSALGRLLSRPWFQRIWCVQEAVLAREIRVLFGSNSVTFEQLITVASVYLIVSQTAARVHQTATWDLLSFNRPNIATECLLATWQKRKLQTSPTGPPSMSLCDLMISTMNQHSSDRRDRVYALYGMVTLSTVKDLPASYAEPIDALSQRVSIYLLDSGNGVWMLVHSGGIGLNRPSWTLDLDRIGVKEKFDPLTGLTRATGQNAMYVAGGTAAPSMQADPSSGCLKVLGAVVDGFASMPSAFTVDLPVLSIAGHGGEAKMTPQLMISYIKVIDAIVKWVESEGTTNQDSEALWRTLIANYNPHPDDSQREPSGRALSGFGRYFDELLVWIRGILDANPPIDIENLTSDDIQKRMIPQDAAKYWIAMIAPHLGRRVAGTSSGALALIPQDSLVSDVIAVFQGVPVPFVLRKAENECFRVVGICYIHGLMNSEGLQDGSKLQEISLL